LYQFDVIRSFCQGPAPRYVGLRVNLRLGNESQCGLHGDRHYM